MQYALWDLETGNRMVAVPTEDEALEIAREFLNEGWNPDELALGVMGGHDSRYTPAITGAALVERARGVPA